MSQALLEIEHLQAALKSFEKRLHTLPFRDFFQLRLCKSKGIW
jgi:hypothetical protein